MKMKPCSCIESTVKDLGLRKTSQTLLPQVSRSHKFRPFCSFIFKFLKLLNCLNVTIIMEHFCFLLTNVDGYTEAVPLKGTDNFIHFKDIGEGEVKNKWSKLEIVKALSLFKFELLKY